MSALGAIEPVEPVLARVHTLLEGPRIAPDGALVYSDVIAGGLYSCSPDGNICELLPGRRGIGGVLPHADGGWVLSGRTVLHLRPDGSQREMLAEDGASGYNDLFSTSSGDLLAGELRYRPMAGEAPRKGRVVRLAGDGSLVSLSERVTWPNGIGVSPDGRTVYVSDYAERLVLSMPLEGGREVVFCRSPRGSADGLAVDEQGGVWVALGEGGGIARFDPSGALAELIDIPAGFVSSISFGGEDRRDGLISTADNRRDASLGGTLLRTRCTVAGVPLTPVGV